MYHDTPENMNFMRLLIFSLVLLISSQLSAQKGLKTILSEHTFVSLEGEEKSLADVIKSHEGKVIYIDFWASWCGPCKKAMPASKQLHQDFEGEDIVFLYLSLDDHPDAWVKALDKLELTQTGEHLRRGRKDAVEMLKFFYIYSIPHYMIIGKDGQIVNRDALPPSDPRAARQLRKWIKRS